MTDEDKINWNVDLEVGLFHAIYAHRPVGKNKEAFCDWEVDAFSRFTAFPNRKLFLYGEIICDCGSLTGNMNIRHYATLLS